MSMQANMWTEHITVMTVTGYLYKVDPQTWTYRNVGKTDGKVVEMSFDYADNRM